MDKIVSILNEIQLPFSYNHYAEGESPKSPFICYLTPKSEYFAADGVVFHRICDYHIELYTDKKAPETEAIVESVLDKHRIFYNKSEVWIDSEKLYETLYSFEMEE